MFRSLRRMMPFLRGQSRPCFIAGLIKLPRADNLRAVSAKHHAADLLPGCEFKKTCLDFRRRGPDFLAFEETALCQTPADRPLTPAKSAAVRPLPPYRGTR